MQNLAGHVGDNFHVQNKMVLWPKVFMGNARRFRGDSMKIGTLCKVTSRTSHYPSQFGHLIVVTRGMKTIE